MSMRRPRTKRRQNTVVHQIEQLVGGTSYFSLDSGRVASDQQAHRDFGEIAVIYRLNAQSRLLVEALERSGIPYQVGGQTLAELPPTREVVAGLWLLHNPAMPVHLHTLLAAHGIELAPALFAALHESVAQGRSLSPSLEDLPATPSSRHDNGRAGPSGSLLGWIGRAACNRAGT